MFRIVGILILLSISGCSESVPKQGFPEVPGTTFEVRVAYSTQLESGYARGHTTILERIIENGEDGLVVEYDFTANTTEADKARDWRFPVRLRIKPDQVTELLNGDELKTRNLEWRARFGIHPEACGEWFFTWNAFKIECDIENVILELETYILHQISLREGQMIRAPGTIGSSVLSMTELKPLTLSAELVIDPDQVRRGRAEEELLVSKLTSNTPITIEEAVEEQALLDVEGTLTTSIQLDQRRRPIERIRQSVISVTDENGNKEIQRSTTTATRRLLSSEAPS